MIHEKQKFGQNWIYFLILFEVVLMGVFMAALWHKGEIQDDPWVIPFVIACMFLPLVLIRAQRMELELTRYRIRYKYVPFSFKWKEIISSEVKAMHLRPVRDLMSVGGFGIRRYRKGRAYLLDGKHLLEVRMTNGRLLSFSITEPDRWKRYLSQEDTWSRLLSEDQV